MKEIVKLKTKLEDAIKDRDEAQKIAQDSCEELVCVRLERDEATEKAKNVDSLIQRETETLTNKVRVDVMNELDPLLMLYNANVLKYRNLAWLGQDYPYLHRAWEFLVSEEKRHHGQKTSTQPNLKAKCGWAMNSKYYMTFSFLSRKSL